tara:strand:+ start:836 stop:1195 length:360 start_codon:yes stop_codon:yes gene_type:complete
MYDKEEPEHNEYDDDYYNYYPETNQEPIEFKFDWETWELWLEEAIKDIVQEQDNVWIVGANTNPQPTELPEGMTSQPLWKKEYFIDNKLAQRYLNYLQSHSKYILKEPRYYKGLFDNLN